MPLPDITTGPAFTTVRFDLAAPTGHGAPTTGTRLLPGKWKFTPVPGARSATSRLAPAEFTAQPTLDEVTAGFFTLDLFATDDSTWLTAWCWKVREPWPGTTRYIAVPRAASYVEYAALHDVDPVDPADLAAAPSPALQHGLERLTRDQAARIADLEAAVLTLQGAATVIGTAAYQHAPIGDTQPTVDTYVAGYIPDTLGGFI